MDTVGDKILPKLIIVLSVIFIIFGCLGFYDFIYENESLEAIENILIVVDLLTGFGLLLRWKIAYILLLLQFALLIVSGTALLIIMLFTFFFGNGQSYGFSELAITLGLFCAVGFFGYLYYLVRRKPIREIYFKSKSRQTLQPAASGDG